MDFMNAYQEQQSDRYDDDKDNAAQKVEDSYIHEAQAAHQKVYQNGEPAPASASDEELGKAAAVEAFNNYEKAEKEGGESGGQRALLQMVMAEASKLFSGSGGGDKSTIVQSAIVMAMKLLMGMSDEGGGGGSDGGCVA